MYTCLICSFLSYENTIASFLIKGKTADQGDILIETGPYTTWDALTAALRRCGSSPEQVRHVFLTHIHLDHAGAAWAFAEKGAQVYVHPLGVAHLNDPSKLISSATRIYGADMDRLWGALRPIDVSRLNAAEDDVVFEVSGRRLRALHTPGHAQHHIAWQMDDLIFTGDVAGICIKGGPVVAPCPPPDLDVELWEQSISRLVARRPSALYLTHFGRVDHDVGAHLEALRRQLRDICSWVEDQLSRYPEAETIEIENRLKQRIVKQLEEAGYSKEIQEAYLLANPPFMSVLGIKRYLRQLRS